MFQLKENNGTAVQPTTPGTVLLVDDDPQIRMILRRVLDRDGYHIMDADDGYDALHKVDVVIPDLVLLDIQMPQLDGIETCLRLRQKSAMSHTPILMLTAILDDATVERAFSAGATDYLTKPMNPSALRHRVRRLVTAYQAERQLRETQERIQSLVSHASDAIITLDQHLMVVGANAAAERLFRMSSDNLIGCHISNRLEFNLTWRPNISTPIESVGLAADGTRVPVEITFADFVTGEGQFHTLFVRDITERKTAELELRNSERLLTATLDTLSAHIAILDRNGTIVAVNEAWKKFARDNGLVGNAFGIGTNYVELCERASGVNAEGATVVADGIRKVMGGQLESFSLEYPCHSPTEKRWFVLRATHRSQETDSPLVIAHENSTSRHLAEEGMVQANEFMSQILESLPTGIAVIDSRGRLKYSNRRLGRILGYSPEALAAQRFSRFVGMRSRRAITAAVRRLNAREVEVAAFEASLRGGDGCFIPARVSLVAIPQDGTFVAIIEDLSERAALAEVLRRRDEEWVATVDAIADLIILEDSLGILKRCNSAAAVFLRKGFTEIVGRATVDLFFPELSGKAASFRQALGERTEIQFAGDSRWFAVESYWIPQERGIGTGWVHIIKDVTTRRLADHAMRRLTTAIEQIVESVVMLTGRGRIQYVNPAFEQASGFQQSEVALVPYFRLPLGPIDRKIRREIVRTVGAGKDWFGVYTARRKSGAIYQEEASISPVLDTGGQLQNIVAVCRDVTDQLRYESIAEAVNVMDNAGYIFSGIRHEMGNPINSVKTALTVLSRTENPTRETVSKYIDRSLIEIGRVEYLLRALRSFSMFETPTLETLPVVPFVSRFCSLIEEDFAKRGIRIVREFDDASPVARFDQRGLHQALMNLFANAADALGDAEAPTITVRITRTGRLVSILIRDNGIGLTPQQTKQLFKPFFTSKPQGTGLGLVITKKLITKMHGTIDIACGEPRGCVATVTLESPDTLPGQ